MDLLFWLLKLYLLCWVAVGVFCMVAVVYLDLRACLCDIALWERRKLR